MDFYNYIKPELLILIPVLYLVGMAVKKSKINDTAIPFILGTAGVFLSMVYVVATTQLNGIQEVATALFTALTQGILVAGASVYINQVVKQSKKGE